MYDNVIKENIRRFRKAKGYTQAEMAEILNISVTYYRSIESGNASLLKPVIKILHWYLKWRLRNSSEIVCRKAMKAH